MEEYFKKIQELRVLIIGDLILDKYYDTDVERLSPEAPIPVARYKKQKIILGGAANVALNVSKFAKKTYLIGQIGADKEGTEIRKETSKNNINLFPIITSSKTISKIRIMSKSNQLLRLDFEDKNLKIEPKKVIKEIKSILNKIDIIIISDYQKGTISKEVIDFLRKQNKYISIDTKPGHFRDFKGFSLIKPNFDEAVGIAKKLGSEYKFKNSDEDLEKLGKYLKEKLKSNILITRSEKGATYIGRKVFHSESDVSNVSDVTGAGDTCIAIFSVLDYLKCDTSTALEIMNAAAKITVSQLGTYAPNISEIKSELVKEEFNSLLNREQVLRINQKLKKEKKKIVFTNGCFDLLHKGHMHLLSEAKKQGDVLIVGINSDSTVKKLKGKNRPILDEVTRAYMLSNLKSVDYVIVFEEETPKKLISLLRPDVHVKGGDYKVKDLPETKIVKKYGGKVIIVKLLDKTSTTNIVKKIRKQ